MKYFKFNRHGQSLAEVLIATTITALLVVAAVALISPVLRNDKYAAKSSTGASLGKELLENVSSFTVSNWQNIALLSTSSANRYYLITSSSPFSVSSGTETVITASTTYSRYFYLDEVRRDNLNGNITTSTIGSAVDPATRMITVVTVVPQGPTSTISYIVTRSQNSVFIQSDWSGGGTFASGTATASTTSQYVSSSNISATGTPGSIVLDIL